MSAGRIILGDFGRAGERLSQRSVAHFASPATSMFFCNYSPERDRGVHGKGVCRPDGDSRAPGMGLCGPWNGRPETGCARAEQIRFFCESVKIDRLKVGILSGLPLKSPPTKSANFQPTFNHLRSFNLRRALRETRPDPAPCNVDTLRGSKLCRVQRPRG
jgi:hypothetical protein